MRKSTLWLAALFLACVVVLGWKSMPAGATVKETVSDWVSDFSLQGVRNFLKWRSPGIALAEQAEEEARLLEAEQQAYAVKKENDAWKEQESDGEGAAAISKNEENKSNQNSGSSQNNENSENNKGGQNNEKNENDGSGSNSENSENSESNQNSENREDSETSGSNQNSENNKNSESSENNENHESQVDEKTDGQEAISFPEYVQAAAAGNQLCYTWSQLTDFDFLTENFYQIHSSTTIYPSQLDGEAYLKKDFSIDRETSGPQILIYHTHGSEDFKDSDPNDPDTLITGVGDVLAKILEDEYGYQVYHDTTVFPYNSSYSRGREKVRQLMEQYPDIQVVIDLHRDSSPNRHLVTDVNGKSTAQIMFFNGMSQTTSGPLTSRNNENLEDNLAFSLQLKLAAEQLYPGFARKNYLKAYRYNMDLAKRYALIEVGAETNTLQEEINAMEPLAEILHCVLQ